MPGSWHPRIPFHAVAVAVILAAGCGPKRVAPKVPTAPPATTLIALLPDPESGVTGHARVSNEFGAANLTTARAATQVKADGAPGAVNAISEADVTRLFGAAWLVAPRSHRPQRHAARRPRCGTRAVPAVPHGTIGRLDIRPAPPVSARDTASRRRRHRRHRRTQPDLGRSMAVAPRCRRPA